MPLFSGYHPCCLFDLSSLSSSVGVLYVLCVSPWVGRRLDCCSCGFELCFRLLAFGLCRLTGTCYSTVAFFVGFPSVR